MVRGVLAVRSGGTVAPVRDIDDSGRPRRELRVHCRCGENATVGAPRSRPDAVVARMFRSRGWEVDSKLQKATCPACQKKN